MTLEQQMTRWVHDRLPAHHYGIAETLVGDEMEKQDGVAVFVMPDEIIATFARIDPAYTPPTLRDVQDAAIAGVKEKHEEMLVMLSGNASVAERDTWPNQKDWAETLKLAGRWITLIEVVSTLSADAADALAPIMAGVVEDVVEAKDLLRGLLTEPELTALDAANVAPSEFMASKVVSKVKAMNALITAATRIKREGDAMITQAETVLAVDEATAALSEIANDAVTQFMASTGA